MKMGNNYYAEVRRFNIAMDERIKKMLVEGEELKVSALILDFSTRFEVSDGIIRKRIKLYVDSIKGLVDEKGVLKFKRGD
jgi:hypothetical protein